MKPKNYWCAYFYDKSVSFGVAIELYPNLATAIKIPFIEILIGIRIKLNKKKLI